MNLCDVPESRRCRAKNRQGQPCKKWTMRGRNRCANHGGKTPQGWASTHYVHGWYSNDPIHRMMRSTVRHREEVERRVARRLREMGFELDEQGKWHRSATP
jgi:hypothetical protein